MKTNKKLMIINFINLLKNIDMKGKKVYSYNINTERMVDNDVNQLQYYYFSRDNSHSVCDSFFQSDFLIEVFQIIFIIICV